LRILLANYRYFVSGGPERYMFNLTDLLEAHGHEIVSFSVRYDQNEPSAWSEYFVEPIAGRDEYLLEQQSVTPHSIWRSVERTLYSREVYRAVSRLVGAAKPDVAIVLHYLRKLSPSVLVALADAGVPSFVRLSDFAMVCPGSHLLRGGHVCTDCVDRGLLPSVRHRCVHGSWLASGLNAAATVWARRHGYFDLPESFIVPTQFARGILTRAGVAGERVTVIPTFVPPSLEPVQSARRAHIAYVGRIDRKKGVDVLLDAYLRMRRESSDKTPDLVVAGDASVGPARDLLSTYANIETEGVRLLGGLSANQVRGVLAASIFSVVPSIWPENLPNSLLESLAEGTPVVASDIGSLTEALADTRAGVLVPPNDSAALCEAMIDLTENASERSIMSEAATRLARDRYSPEAHYAALMRVLRPEIEDMPSRIEP